MGMGYQYAGSSSYPRFDNEIDEIARLFGGIATAELKNRKDSIKENTIDYWFGYASSVPEMEKYVFPQDVNKVLVKWLNHPYNDFNENDTKIIYRELCKYRNIVETIAEQIMCEFEHLTKFDEGWGIA